MSPSSPPAAGHAMRQQLDELDALLQRMLAYARTVQRGLADIDLSKLKFPKN